MSPTNRLLLSSKSRNSLYPCDALSRCDLRCQSSLQTGPVEIVYVQSNGSPEESPTRLDVGRVSDLFVFIEDDLSNRSFDCRCGDNIEYGYRFSRDFVDTPEKEISTNSIPAWMSNAGGNQTGNGGRPRKPLRRGRIRRQMNIHNNEVGRRVSLPAENQLFSKKFSL